MNFVTIIIPVLNSGKYFADCLDCIAGFDKKVSVLVADGGSTDNTKEIISKYRRNGLKISLVSDHDTGQSDALNILLRKVKTPFFFWLNADDLINPEFLRKAGLYLSGLEPATLNNTVSVSANNYLIDEQGLVVGRQPGMLDNAWLVKQGVWFGKFPCRVWNTELVRAAGGFDTHLNFSMDFSILFKIVTKNSGLKFHHFDDFLGAFRLHEESKTGSKSSRALVHQEMRDFLGFSAAKWYWTRFLSLLLRAVNFKYLLLRFLPLKLNVFSRQNDFMRISKPQQFKLFETVKNFALKTPHLITEICNFVRNIDKIFYVYTHCYLDAKYFENKRLLILGPADIVIKQLKYINLNKFDIVIRLNKSIEVPIEHRGKLLGEFDVLFHNLNEHGPRNAGALSKTNFEKTGVKLVIFGFGFIRHYINVYKNLMQLQNFGVDLRVIPPRQYRQFKNELGGWYPTTGYIAVRSISEMNYKHLCIAGFSFFQTQYIKSYNNNIRNGQEAMAWALEFQDHNPLLERVVMKNHLMELSKTRSLRFIEY